MPTIKLRKQMPKHSKHQSNAHQSFAHYIGSKLRTNRTTEGENTYVYESFNQKLKKIDVLLSHYTSDIHSDTKLLADSGDTITASKQSYFIDKLISLIDSCQRHETKQAYKQLSVLSHSFALILLNKAKITKCLSERMEKTLLIIDIVEVFDLFASLVKDLKEDMYDEFLTIVLPKITGLLSIQDERLIEKIFSTLSICIKYFATQISKQPLKMYKYYFELLAHSNPQFRVFSSQSFAYCLKKGNFSAQEIISYLMEPIIHPTDYFTDEAETYSDEYAMLEQIILTPDVIVGSTSSILSCAAKYVYSHYYKISRILRHTFATMIFESVRGLQGTINNEYMDIAIQLLNCISQYHQHYYFLFTVVEVLNLMIADYLSLNELNTYISILIKTARSLINQNNESRVVVNLILFLLKDIIGYKNGKLISDSCVSTIIDFIREFTESIENKCSFTCANCCEVFAVLVCLKYKFFRSNVSLFQSTVTAFSHNLYFLVYPIVNQYKYSLNLYDEVLGKSYDDASSIESTNKLKIIKPIMRCMLAILARVDTNIDIMLTILRILDSFQLTIDVPYYKSIMQGNSILHMLASCMWINKLDSKLYQQQDIWNQCCKDVQECMSYCVSKISTLAANNTPIIKYNLVSFDSLSEKEEYVIYYILSKSIANAAVLSKYQSIPFIESIKSNYQLLTTFPYINIQLHSIITDQQINPALSSYLYKSDPVLRMFAVQTLLKLSGNATLNSMLADIKEFLSFEPNLDNLMYIRSVVTKIIDVYAPNVNQDAYAKELLMNFALGNLWIRLSPIHELSYKLFMCLYENDSSSVTNYLNKEMHYLVSESHSEINSAALLEKYKNTLTDTSSPQYGHLKEMYII